MYKKQQEFECWLREIRGLDVSALPRSQVSEYFRTFAEDFNTVTLPHVKYYDLESWERRERVERMRSAAASAAVEGRELALGGIEDEKRRRVELAEAARAAQAERMRLYLASMSKDKVEAMRRRQELEQQMQVAFKSGDMREVARIKRILEPEERPV